MAGWTCKACGRWFGKRRAHVCQPALTLEAWFARRPDARDIVAALQRGLKRVDDLHVEAVDVGIFFKRERTFAELRPRREGFSLSFILRREVSDPRITRRIAMPGGRVVFFVVVKAAADVDRRMRDWLIESCATA